MKNRLISFTLLFSLLAFGGCAQVDNKSYLSPESIVSDSQGKNVYVCMSTAGYVAVVDALSGKVTGKISVSEQSSGITLSPVAPLLFVTAGVSPGKVYVFNHETGKLISEIKLGHSPIAPVISPDGKFLYVSSRFGNYVSVIDVEKNSVVQQVPVSREPVAATITPDGKYLFIGHLLPEVPADREHVASTVSIINTTKQVVCKTIQLPNGSTDLHGMAISPDGKYVYVTHQIAFYSLPTNQLERGWMNTNVFSIIDVRSQEIFNTVLLDDIDLGAANPRGITVSDDGQLLIVAHSGTNEISIIDRKALHEKLDQVHSGVQVSVVSQRKEDVPTDFSFLVGIRERVSLQGIGPRGVSMAGRKIFVSEYFSGSIGIINPHNLQHIQSASLGKEPEMSSLRRGEILFNDATKCFQHWQSCASCHPDGRMDGLDWDLLNDGIGNSKNVKSLLYSHQTPPVMGHGVRASAEVAVRSGFKYILFSNPEEQDAAAVDEYLKSLRPTPSPYLVDGELSEQAQIGKKLFDQAGCINCHSGAYYTNLKSYDVSTLRRWDKRNEKPLLDVPSLIEVWRTAPYLHDGRTMSVEEAFKSCDSEGVKGLSPQEIKALSEFVLSL